MSDLPNLTLSTDSIEYEILYHAATQTIAVPGMTCEIGVRRGGASELIMLATQQDHGALRLHVGIDPWGNLPYPEGLNVVHHDYNHTMRRETLASLYGVAAEHQFNLQCFVLTDTEFFKRYEDGVPVYVDGVELLHTDYAFVHFDGPHAVANLQEEIAFFAPRTPIGGYWVFDDIGMYDHSAIDRLVLMCGFERNDHPLPFSRPSQRKAAYRKGHVGHMP